MAEDAELAVDIKTDSEKPAVDISTGETTDLVGDEKLVYTVTDGKADVTTDKVGLDANIVEFLADMTTGGVGASEVNEGIRHTAGVLTGNIGIADEAQFVAGARTDVEVRADKVGPTADVTIFGMEPTADVASDNKQAADPLMETHDDKVGLTAEVTTDVLVLLQTYHLEISQPLTSQ